MKIFHVVYSLEMGGAEVLVGQLCRIQRAQGHTVAIFAYSNMGVVGEALQAEGFEIYLPGEAHPLRTMARYLRRFLAMKPDVVHCHNVAPTTQAAIPARVAGVPRVISTLHGLRVYPDGWRAAARYNFMGWFCDWQTGICEVTCANMRSAPLAWREKIVRVYNGASAVEWAQFTGLGKRGFTLVFIGRLAPEKALDTLLRAVALAHEQVEELALWIVGDGRARGGWEALAAELGLGEQVTFWGQRMDTAQFFSAADAFVMSSVTEGLPMSLLQAMSLGTPSILTDVGGMGEVLRLTGGGLLVPVGDPAAMAAAIVRLAGDQVLYGQLSDRARVAYAAAFTLERMADAYMALYVGGEVQPG